MTSNCFCPRQRTVWRVGDVTNWCASFVCTLHPHKSSIFPLIVISKNTLTYLTTSFTKHVTFHCFFLAFWTVWRFEMQRIAGNPFFCKSEPAKSSIINKLWFPKNCTHLTISCTTNVTRVMRCSSVQGILGFILNRLQSSNLRINTLLFAKEF